MKRSPIVPQGIEPIELMRRNVPFDPLDERRSLPQPLPGHFQCGHRNVENRYVCVPSDQLSMIGARRSTAQARNISSDVAGLG
jgi:hypothetical protein